MIDPREPHFRIDFVVDGGDSENRSTICVKDRNKARLIFDKRKRQFDMILRNKTKNSEIKLSLAFITGVVREPIYSTSAGKQMVYILDSTNPRFMHQTFITVEEYMNLYSSFKVLYDSED